MTTIDEELELIKRSRAMQPPPAEVDSVDPVPGAFLNSFGEVDIAPDADAMAARPGDFAAQAAQPEPDPAAPPVRDIDAELGLPPPEAGLAKLPEQDAGFWEVAGASWQSETVKTDAWNYSERLRRDATSAIWDRLPDDARQRIMDLKWDQANNWMRFEDLVVDEAAKIASSSPESAADFAGVPLSKEAFEAQIMSQRKAALAEAEGVLGTSDRWFAEFVGAGARAMTDETSLMLMPFGVSGSAWRMIAGEALLGAAGEAAILPREFQVADELGLQDPDPVSRILMGAALGGGLSAGIIGVVKGVSHLRARRAGIEAARPEGMDALDAEIAVEEAEGAMRGDQTVAEVIGKTSPTPGTLPAILGNTGTRAVVKMENTGAIRRQPIQPKLETSLSQAVGEVFGPGYQVRVYSGGQPSSAEGGPRTGSTRHDHGNAADVKVYGPDGKQLTGDALAPLIQYWLARRIGGVGAEMSGGGLHLDLHTDRAKSWNYADQGGQFTPAQAAAMQAGLRGEMPRVGGVIGAPLRGALPNTPGLSYNEDATISAIIGRESSFDPLARNPRSTAAGLGQILSGTWMELVQKHRPELLQGRTPNQVLALRDDPTINREMTTAYARDNHAALIRAGVPAGPGEIYLAHFLGPTGAIRALKADLEAPISAVMSPKQIADNKGVRWGGRALADFRVYDLVQWSRHKMRAAFGDSTGMGGEVPAVAPTSRGYTGTGQVTAGDGMRVDVEYVVVDASTLTRASGDMQPRDRSRGSSDAWIADTAARLDPAQLMPSPTADRGAPIIGPDNMIESGNGRYGAIVRAYERFPDRAAAYRGQIEAAGFAIPEDVSRPVLVARRTSDLSREDRVRFAIEAQDSGVAVMTPTEMAQAFSRAMTGDVLARFDASAALTDGANGAFVRAAMANLPRSSRNAMFDGQGLLNRQGERQLREALFARAWNDPDIIEMFAETDAGGLRSLMDALEASVPNWAALKADIEAGLVRPEMDISGHILDAMRLIGNARKLAAAEQARRAALPRAERGAFSIGDALTELLDEVDLLAGPVAPLTVALVRKFWTGGKAAPAAKVADFLTRYADDARKVGKAGSLFDDAPGPREVLQAIDPKTFGDLPQDLGPVRGFARPNSGAPEGDLPPQALPDQGFDAGATSPEALAVQAEIRAELEPPPARAAQDELDGEVLDPISDADAAELWAARAEFAEFEIDMPDGTSARVSDVLADLDQDAGFDAFLQACALSPVGGAQ